MNGCQSRSPSYTSCWRTAVYVFLLCAATTRQSSSQAQSLDRSYNCSYSHLLGVNDSTTAPGGVSDNPSCQESCIQVSPALAITQEENCTSLRDILEMYKDNIIPPDDCLELVFAPGNYMLSSLSQVTVEYSLVLVAPEGGVNLACASSLSLRDECGSKGESPMMTFNKPAGTNNMFVMLSGITFRYCSRQEFDELDYLSVTHCEFV